MHPAPPPLARGLMWFRRDLRAEDNAALYHALRRCRQLWCVFVFDPQLLDPLPRADRRVEFIRESLVDLDEQLRALGRAHGRDGVGLLVRHGLPQQQIPELAAQLGVQAVFANHDDEPAAKARDAQVLGRLVHQGVMLHTHKDHLIFERDEVLTQQDRPFSVFTPYKRAWLARLTPYHLQAYPVERHAAALAPAPTGCAAGVPTLQTLGFEHTNLRSLPFATGSRGAAGQFEDFLTRIDRYHQTRDYPAVRGPSYLSVHLRFGTLSPRLLARTAHAMMERGVQGAGSWLNELIWRDFYAQILAHFPHVVERAFKPAFDAIRWERGKRAEQLFAAWCAGRTGFPLVDAAMAQLNQSGYMHNRLRMVSASFLCKDLGLDWRRGEAYFAEKLIDFDLASNNGGWQWAASSGCDAQPWFRIFNPVTQSQRFDPQGKFIHRYLPELARLQPPALHAPWTANPMELEAAGLRLGERYPAPLVDHAVARQKTLARYAVVRSSS